jgi:hypothetical protein
MEFVNHHYSIWIEAEEWAPGKRNPADDNSDVIVTFPRDERWVATFFSYQNIRSLIEKNLASGECLGGKYLAATQMILVDEVSRERIEEVVADLMKQNEFSSYFARCDDAVDVAV